MNQSSSSIDLHSIARQVIRERGFNPQFSPEAQQQLARITSHPVAASPSGDIRDLRHLLWSSIDNDDSRDLDQIEYAESISSSETKILVGIADVDACVSKVTPLDAHAARETTTLYTGIEVFPMLPVELSTGLTSLNENADRLSIVVEFIVDAAGEIQSGNVYRAVVRNRAQLAYSAVGAWLQGSSTAAPNKIAASTELQSQLRLQDEAAQRLREQRYKHGALNLESAEIHPVMSQGQVVGILDAEKNRASNLIEELMIAANETVARLLEAKKVSSIRRVVKTPERWDRIVALAAEHGGNLPATPDSKALNDFLIQRRAADPDHFADVSLVVVKLMGPGEYVLERPGDPSTGHFGLAIQDYTHSTAPNRRFPDVITQRLVKAAFAHQPTPYTDAELNSLAERCTERQDAARKVERDMRKRIAAVALHSQIGTVFDAIVTGNNEHGTFVRVLKPHVEGMLIRGQDGLDVGDRLRAKLVNTDAHRGYIDFARA
ncbi:MAG TPA: RNB domain-containing ribonuclease [Terriglobales bacterium]|nr:RNB domain-containing ribonuclease [Terriglobales bacterium]